MKFRWREIQLSQTSQYRLFLVATVLSVAQGLTITGIGIMVRYQTGAWLRYQVQTDPVACLYTNFFKPDKASTMAPLRLISLNVGSTLLYVGVVVVLVSDLGLAGALFLRPLLVLFMLMMTMVVLTEIVTATLLLRQDSFLNRKAKDAASLTMDDQAILPDTEKTYGAWINGLQLLMVKLDCCGVQGPQDFVATYNNKLVPETCCRRDFVQAAMQQKSQQCQNTTSAKTGTYDARVGDHSVRKCHNVTLTESDLKNCTQFRPNTYGYTEFQKAKGCFDVIFELVQSSLGWLIPAICCVLLTQVSMVTCSIFVFNKRLSLARSPPVCEPV